MALTAPTVAERLAEVHERIAGAGADVRGVRIVAVTKGFGPEAVLSANQAGLDDVGENYADELLEKREAVGDGARRRWHFLGRVQRNKVRRIAGFVHLWQAVDRLAAGQEISRRAPGAGVLVQVNVSGEPQKHGCPPEAVPELVAQLRELELDTRGLMAVGPTGPAESARAGFALLARLVDLLGLP